MTTRKRLRSRTLTVVEGGGGGGPPVGGTVVWGPHFGNPPELTVGARVTLESLGLAGEHQVGAQVVLADVAPVYADLLGAGAQATMPAVALAGAHQVGVGAQLVELDLLYAQSLGVGAQALLAVVGPSYAQHQVGAAITEANLAAVVNRAANAAANDGPDNWTNPNNATGQPDGSEASRAGQVLGTTNGNLRLNYADFTGGIETFTIQQVFLHYWTRQTGTLLNNGGLTHWYRLSAGVSGDPGWTQVGTTQTGNVTNDPLSFNITSAVAGNWSNLDALQTRVQAALGAATTGVTCFCDAVVVEVQATKVVSL